MKKILCLAYILMQLPLSATPYSVWRADYRTVDVNSIQSVASAIGYSLIDNEQGDGTAQEGSDDIPIPGTICYYFKTNIVHDHIDVKYNLEEIYQQSKITPPPFTSFLDFGTEYILIDQSSEQCYYCLIETGKVYYKGMESGTVRIALAPLVKLDENIFLFQDELSIIYDASVTIPLSKMIRSKSIIK